MRRTVELIGGPKCGQTVVAEDGQKEFRVFVRKERPMPSFTDSGEFPPAPVKSEWYGVGVYQRLVYWPTEARPFSSAVLSRVRFRDEIQASVDFYWQGEIDG